MAAEIAGESGGKLTKPSSRKSSGSEGGFFHIYKSGQGYWTRMMTFCGSMLIGGLTAWFFYGVFAAQIPERKYTVMGICTGFFAFWGLLTHWIMNKPASAEFLIATDDEMKKVNWTSRAELIGSTKVVIGFMLFLAVALFLIDVAFGTFFFQIGILKVGPFGMGK